MFLWYEQSSLLVQRHIHFHYESMHNLNLVSNYLEISANHADHKILQGIAKVLQCYDKRQCFLLE